MTTLYGVLKAVQAQISAVTVGLISQSPDTPGQALTVFTGIYWPSEKTLQDNVRTTHPDTSGPTSLITVYDRGIAADSTRWKPNITSTTILPATMTVTVSQMNMPALGISTLTFVGPITIGDAVGIVLGTQLLGREAVVPIAVAGDTPATMAAKAVSLFMADPLLAAMATATAVGAVVTLASRSASAYTRVTADVGNNGTRVKEVGRRRRHFQIVIWARTPDDRTTVGDPIEGLIAGLESDFGLTFADGTMGRLTFSGDTEHDTATLSDTMRRDFMICVDYGITVTDMTYSILAPIARNTTL